MIVHCDYCSRPAERVTGREIYPYRVDLHNRWFWRCKPCGAHVGCHPAARSNGKGGIGDGTVPLGRLANAELRRAKQAAHAAFDPLWRSREMTRKEAYRWLADALGISVDNCHIGMFDLDGCRAVVAATLQRRNEKECI